MEADITQKFNLDTLEVKNYIDALTKGEILLRTIPISTRMILELHREILRDGRGKNCSPGEYRKIQNWIGSTSRIEDASYIPSSPDKLGEYMSNLEKYINDDFKDDIDPLIKIAVIHAQFESIHPFLDGNGRVGRILIMLYLLDKKVITKPTFFVSEELEKNKFKYYSMLNNLRTEEPKWEDWISFFLESVIRQAEKNITKLRKVEELYNEVCNYAEKNNIKIDYVRAIFKRPMFMIKTLEKGLNVSYSSVKTNIKKLMGNGKIFTNENRRNTLYFFTDLLDILRD